MTGTPAARWGAAAIVAAVVVSAATVWVLRSLPEPAAPADQLAYERAGTIAAALDRDLEAALQTLPVWAVATLEDPEDVSVPVAGTVAVTSGPQCIGVRLGIGAGWVTDGDQDDVSVGPVSELPESACGR